jgi:DNA-binding HxlR family transcriptional regulator
LEQAVIDAARAVNGNVDYVSGDMEMVNLYEALVALDKLRETEKPRASAIAPPTSHDAAAWAAKTQKSWHRRILRLLFAKPVNGATVDELERHFQASHQTMSPRVNELVNAGWLEDSGERRETRSGTEAIAWKLTPVARQVMRRVLA